MSAGNVVYIMPVLPPSDEADEWVASLTVTQMKYLWDHFEKWQDSDPGCFVLEAIHREMNKRGEGVYVAV